MRLCSITMLRTLRWACLAGPFPSLERKQIRDLHLERPGKLLQPGHRWRVHAALDQTDEIYRAADLFRQPGLGARRFQPFPELVCAGQTAPRSRATGADELFCLLR